MRLIALYVAGIALCLGLGVAFGAPAPTLGTITIDNPAPHYGDPLTFTYHVEKRDRTMTGALLCWQTPGQYNVVYEWPMDSHSNDGTFSGTISEPYPPNLPPFDTSLPAACMAYVFREPRGQDSGAILTNVLSFTVNP